MENYRLEYPIEPGFEIIRGHKLRYVKRNNQLILQENIGYNCEQWEDVPIIEEIEISK